MPKVPSMSSKDLGRLLEKGGKIFVLIQAGGNNLCI